MNKLAVGFVLILLVFALQYLEPTGNLVRSQFAKSGQKISMDKEKYVLLPNDKVLHLTITAKDAYVWKAAFYCKQPCKDSYDWITFDFEGPILPNTEDMRWMDGHAGRSAMLTIPREYLRQGKNYFAVYTCEGVNKCNGDKWLLFPVEVYLVPEASDVSVSSVYVDLPEKNTASFFMIIKNTGTIASPSGILRYKVTDLDTAKTMSESTLVMPSILPKKTGVTTRVTFPLKETIRVGVYVVLDPANKIIELDETNNEYYIVREFNPQYPAPPR